MPKHTATRELTYAECEAIAKKLNQTLPGITESQSITAEHVYKISAGQDRMESHPVWQRINTEIRHLRAAPPKKGRTKPTRKK